ncbi:hypothetical protein P7H15_14060 [Paenibacillus larvae]|nr:hypothetical protein [Paenibacillus larvae]MDT2293726.1 hypothetical protein [Paenibacillus larvae]
MIRGDVCRTCLIATGGSIIYFKQLSEANADKAKYNILRKVGVT